jgi:hypothetical protein
VFAWQRKCDRPVVTQKTTIMQLLKNMRKTLLKIQHKNNYFISAAPSEDTNDWFLIVVNNNAQI